MSEFLAGLEGAHSELAIALYRLFLLSLCARSICLRSIYCIIAMDTAGFSFFANKKFSGL